MNLITKCASCGTTFRVTEQQLQAHNGKVRCGTCKTVFDGLTALVTLPEPAPDVPPQAAVGAGGAAGFELRPVIPAANTPAPVALRPLEAAREEPDYGPAPEQLSLDDQLYPAAPQRGARWWAAGAALLALALGAQAVFFYRADLAAQYPGLKPYLVQFCGMLRCAV